jgi:hypothetical protein
MCDAAYECRRFFYAFFFNSYYPSRKKCVEDKPGTDFTIFIQMDLWSCLYLYSICTYCTTMTANHRAVFFGSTLVRGIEVIKTSKNCLFRSQHLPTQWNLRGGRRSRDQ